MIVEHFQGFFFYGDHARKPLLNFNVFHGYIQQCCVFIYVYGNLIAADSADEILIFQQKLVVYDKPIGIFFL